MTCGWHRSSDALADKIPGISSKTWTGLRGYEARGNATPTVCRVTLVGGDDRLRRTFENLPSLLRPDDNEKRKSERRETSLIRSPSKELSRNGNSSSDCSCGGDCHHGNGRRHSNRVRNNDQEVSCSLSVTEQFPRGVSSEKENVFESDLGTSSFFNNTQDRTSAESVVLSVGQRKLILSTDILRLVPANRPPLLPTAKSHRTTVFPQQTPKPQSASYVDPVINCSSEFQQRLTELTSLQFETVRWERLRKARKKKADS